MNPVIPKIKIKVALSKEQVAAIKSDIVKNDLIQKACFYADIHFNTFKKSLKGNPIKREQAEKLMEFCELVQKEKAA